MNKKFIKRLTIALTSTALIFALVGCGSTSNTTSNSTTKKEIPKQTKQVEEPVGTAVDLGAGTFACPDNIKPGIYDLSLVGTSDGHISAVTQSEDTSLNFTEDRLNNDSSDGDSLHSIVDKMRIKVIDGTKLTINGINKIHFEPVKSQPELTNTVINAGRYENFKPGRYTVTALYGDGAVYIMNKDSAEQQQMLSDGVAGTDPKTATITLKKGDVIFNSGIRQVKFERIGDK